MKVKIIYFKLSGKYYTEDEDVDWPRDDSHYSGHKPFEQIVRIKNMHAVCMETPLGFPAMYVPRFESDPVVRLEPGDACQCEKSPRCLTPATEIAANRRMTPKVYCEGHADMIAHGDNPEYTPTCPNCGCVFGV